MQSALRAWSDRRSGDGGQPRSRPAAAPPRARRPTPGRASTPCRAARPRRSPARRQTRSSAHYDPFHNLICVVRGAKALALAGPAATAALRPLPLWGESSNHAASDLEPPAVPEARGAGELPQASAATPRSSEAGLAGAVRGQGLAAGLRPLCEGKDGVASARPGAPACAAGARGCHEDAVAGADRSENAAHGLEGYAGAIVTVALQAGPLSPRVGRPVVHANQPCFRMPRCPGQDLERVTSVLQ